MIPNKFGDLLPGTRFRWNGRVYSKLPRNLAAEEGQRVRFLFPTELEVELLDADNRQSGVDCPPSNTHTENPPA
jgi:hypothetical protein